MDPIGGSKIVLTGGPCAGKSTLARLLTHAFETSVVNVPEAASLLFSGGFPRFDPAESKCAVQRAIFHVQLQLEASYMANFSDKVLILDRATIDGAAYWPEGVEAYFLAMGTTLEKELARYDRVIYLQSAGKEDYLLHRSKNPNRRESWEEAKDLDDRTFALWSKHPNFIHIKNDRAFSRKVSEVFSAVAASIPFPDGSGGK